MFCPENDGTILDFPVRRWVMMVSITIITSHYYCYLVFLPLLRYSYYYCHCCCYCCYYYSRLLLLLLFIKVFAMYSFFSCSRTLLTITCYESCHYEGNKLQRARAWLVAIYMNAPRLSSENKAPGSKFA